jgi:hypothetical protein
MQGSAQTRIISIAAGWELFKLSDSCAAASAGAGGAACKVAQHVFAAIKRQVFQEYGLTGITDP